MSDDRAAVPIVRPRWALGLGAVLLLLLIGATALRSYRDLERSRDRERRLAAEIAATKDRIGRLDLEINRLRDDPATLERLAREELGMVRATDVVIVLPEGQPATGAARSTPAPAPAPAAAAPVAPPAPEPATAVPVAASAPTPSPN